MGVKKNKKKLPYVVLKVLKYNLITQIEGIKRFKIDNPSFKKTKQQNKKNPAKTTSKTQQQKKKKKKKKKNLQKTIKQCIYILVCVCVRAHIYIY